MPSAAAIVVALVCHVAATTAAHAAAAATSAVPSVASHECPCEPDPDSFVDALDVAPLPGGRLLLSYTWRRTLHRHAQRRQPSSPVSPLHLGGFPPALAALWDEFGADMAAPPSDEGAIPASSHGVRLGGWHGLTRLTVSAAATSGRFSGVAAPVALPGASQRALGSSDTARLLAAPAGVTVRAEYAGGDDDGAAGASWDALLRSLPGLPGIAGMSLSGGLLPGGGGAADGGSRAHTRWDAAASALNAGHRGGGIAVRRWWTDVRGTGGVTREGSPDNGSGAGRGGAGGGTDAPSTTEYTRNATPAGISASGVGGDCGHAFTLNAPPAPGSGHGAAWAGALRQVAALGLYFAGDEDGVDGSDAVCGDDWRDGAAWDAVPRGTLGSKSRGSSTLAATVRRAMLGRVPGYVGGAVDVAASRLELLATAAVDGAGSAAVDICRDNGSRPWVTATGTVALVLAASPLSPPPPVVDQVATPRADDRAGVEAACGRLGGGVRRRGVCGGASARAWGGALTPASTGRVYVHDAAATSTVHDGAAGAMGLAVSSVSRQATQRALGHGVLTTSLRLQLVLLPTPTLEEPRLLTSTARILVLSPLPWFVGSAAGMAGTAQGTTTAAGGVALFVALTPPVGRHAEVLDGPSAAVWAELGATAESAAAGAGVDVAASLASAPVYAAAPRGAAGLHAAVVDVTVSLNASVTEGPTHGSSLARYTDVTVSVSLPFRVPGLLHAEECAPDTHRGLDVPAGVAHAALVAGAPAIAAGESSGGGWRAAGSAARALHAVAACFDARGGAQEEGADCPHHPWDVSERDIVENSGGPPRQRSASLLLALPTVALEAPCPDFSMPFNAVVLVATAAAFVLGSAVNAAARAPRGAARGSEVRGAA